MPPRYDNTVRCISAEDYPRHDITSPCYEWPTPARAHVHWRSVGANHHVGDTLTLPTGRVRVLAVELGRYSYLVAPDVPGVGLTIAARRAGRFVRRCNMRVLDWLWDRGLLTTPEHVIPSWRDLRFLTPKE